MAGTKITPKQLQEIREFAAEWGKIVARRVFGDAGPDATVDFFTMEEVAQAAATGLTEGTLATLLEKQAATLDDQHPCPACQTLCTVQTKDRTPRRAPRRGSLPRTPLSLSFLPEGLFPPLRPALKLDSRSYSPATTLKIAEASGLFPSYKHAALAMKFAGVPISARHVQRIASEVGAEMASKRDEKVVQRRRRELPVRVAATPEVVAVEVDGGRSAHPRDGQRAGVHQQQNKEDKVACLVTLKSAGARRRPAAGAAGVVPRSPAGATAGAADARAGRGESPQEEDRTRRCARRLSGDSEEANEGPPRGAAAARADVRGEHGGQPGVRADDGGRGAGAGLLPGQATGVRGRRCGVQLVDPAGLLPGLRADSGLPARAVLPVPGGLGGGRGRGGAVVDLRGVDAGVLAGAGRGGDRRSCGSGKSRIGAAARGEGVRREGPEAVGGGGVELPGNNESRMDYPRYRQEGLPITSSLVESLVGEFNARVKSKQKYLEPPRGRRGHPATACGGAERGRPPGPLLRRRPGNPYRRRKAA